MLVVEGSLINKKPRITNQSNFLHPSHVKVDEATNYKLIPALTRNVFHKHFTWALENGLY